MRITGQRIIVFGDSLSHHGPSDAPEIWDVRQGSARPSGAPGDLLASILAERGAAAVRVNANVSRSAGNFWTKTARYQFQAAEQLLASDRAWKPTAVVIWLGTNDAYSGTMNATALTKIRDAYRAMGAEVWALGPPPLPTEKLNAGVEKVYGVLRAVLGEDRVIDTRPLMQGVTRAGDGVHFTVAGAKLLAPRLADALVTASQGKGASAGEPPKDALPGVKPTKKRPAWLGPALLFAGVLGVGLLAMRLRRGAQLRDALPGGKGDDRPDSAFDPKALRQGIQVEMEHTRDRRIAKEIAKDHLTEDPAYYRKLKKIHLDGDRR